MSAGMQWAFIALIACQFGITLGAALYLSRQSTNR